MNYQFDKVDEEVALGIDKVYDFESSKSSMDDLESYIFQTNYNNVDFKYFEDL